MHFICFCVRFRVFPVRILCTFYCAGNTGNMQTIFPFLCCFCNTFKPLSKLFEIKICFTAFSARSGFFVLWHQLGNGRVIFRSCSLNGDSHTQSGVDPRMQPYMTAHVIDIWKDPGFAPFNFEFTGKPESNLQFQHRNNSDFYVCVIIQMNGHLKLSCSFSPNACAVKMLQAEADLHGRLKRPFYFYLSAGCQFLNFFQGDLPAILPLKFDLLKCLSIFGVRFFRLFFHDQAGDIFAAFLHKFTVFYFFR